MSMASCCAGVRHGSSTRPPLLMFNGIGADLELAEPFMAELEDTAGIIFDVPGVGGFARAKLSLSAIDTGPHGQAAGRSAGYDRVDVSGVSWGGGMAQQFAFQYPALCRKLVLAATAPASTMFPGTPSVLSMASPAATATPATCARSRPGDLWRRLSHRPNPDRQTAHGLGRHRTATCATQLLAMSGWTSLPWLWICCASRR